MKNKYVATTLAFTLGLYGVHRFYLGQRVRGCIQFAVGAFSLMITIFEGEPLIVIPALVAFIDSVLLLAMPKEEFDEKFNKKYLSYIQPRRQRQQFYDTASYEEEQAYDAPPVAPRENRKAAPRRRNVNPYKSSGVAKFNDYDYDGAIKDFKKALRHKYDDSTLHFNLACCYSINEEPEASFFHMDKAISFGFVDFDKIHKHNALAFLRTEDGFDEFVKNGYRLATNDLAPPINELPKVDQHTEAATQEDLLDQIVKLGDLREKGILTDEEFQAQKQKLMNRD